MRYARRPIAAAVLLIPLSITGCSLLPTTRKLPIPKAPVITQYATPDELVTRLNERWKAINSLTAKVEFRASKVKNAQGLVTDYPAVEGHILMRKPGDLRVLGQLIGVKVFDMASHGDCYTLEIPHDDKVIKGCGPAKNLSKNAFENLRPGFFFDAMLVQGLAPDDLYQTTSDSETVEDAARKHLFTVPEYILSISRSKPGTQQLIPLRVVTFHRDNLLPSKQDLYDGEGKLETEVVYANYQDFDGKPYPSIVSIKRPQEGVQIVLSVEDVKENPTLTDDQFVVTYPKDYKVVNQE
ncbi:MAG: hypothetical protein ABSF53_19150 [Terracidiphilus sp.]|jgi:hypothetical protein